jgi:hypothetical protein
MKKPLIFGLIVAFALTITGALAGLTAAKATAQTQALDYYNTAKELAAQGVIAYPVAFIDFSLWNDAVNNAAAAVQLDPENMLYMRYLGELYTTTQWWSEGYKVWKDLESKQPLDTEAAGWAAKTAAKMGYLRLQRNLKQEAIPFLIDSLRWKEDAQVRALLVRAQK